MFWHFELNVVLSLIVWLTISVLLIEILASNLLSSSYYQKVHVKYFVFMDICVFMDFIRTWIEILFQIKNNNNYCPKSKFKNLFWTHNSSKSKTDGHCKLPWLIYSKCFWKVVLISQEGPLHVCIPHMKFYSVNTKNINDVWMPLF